MSDSSSFWHTTCTAIRTGNDPSWREVYDYREPVLLLMRMHYAWLGREECEDLVQDIILELREGLAKRYQPDRGPFRAFLRGVVHKKVLARWKRMKVKQRRSLESVPEPVGLDEGDEETIDMVAQVVGAIRRWHDRYASGPDRDRTKIYVVTGRLVRADTYAKIAKREGVSVDGVKRILTAARIEIVADLLEHDLPLAEEAKAGLDWRALAVLVREALADTAREGQILAGLVQDEVREAVQLWVQGLRSVVARLRRGDSVEGDELRHGLEEILASA
jgi:DNA-directed RNA polymerase specialized sigma24 family protein